MSEDVRALVEQVRAAFLTINDEEFPRWSAETRLADAALDSLTAALERAERERDEAEKRSDNAVRERQEWRALAQKAEAVVEAARRANHELDQWVFADGTAAYRVERAEKILQAALTAYDEPPTEQG